MKLKTEEVEKLLLAEKVKLRMSLKEIKTLLANLDKDGKIDTDELLQKVGGGPKKNIIKKSLEQRSVVRKQFEKYDKDGKGYITSEEFRKVVQNKFSSTMTAEEIEKMMKDADKDGDGTIDYEEFLKAFSYAFAK